MHFTDTLFSNWRSFIYPGFNLLERLEVTFYFQGIAFPTWKSATFKNGLFNFDER